MIPSMGHLQIIIYQWQCNRCINKKTGKPHVWIARVTHPPVRCPNCKSPYWNKPRKYNLNKHPTYPRHT